jgi:hypothetical protein
MMRWAWRAILELLCGACLRIECTYQVTSDRFGAKEDTSSQSPLLSQSQWTLHHSRILILVYKVDKEVFGSCLRHNPSLHHRPNNRRRRRLPPHPNDRRILRQLPTSCRV